MRQLLFDILVVALLAYVAIYWIVKVSVHVWPGI